MAWNISTVVDVLPTIAKIVKIAAFIASLNRMVIIDIRIIMAIIVVMTVIFVMAVYCTGRNGCNIYVYCFIGNNDYNCLNGL